MLHWRSLHTPNEGGGLLCEMCENDFRTVVGKDD